uniref:Peptidase S1 domain-containing protein n=1 Tax=Ditylenchus dipsaci TaxID=166011 RepID=A0A915EGR8_9BILA
MCTPEKLKICTMTMTIHEAEKLGVHSDLAEICQEISHLKQEMVEQCDITLEKQYKLEDLPDEFQEILNCPAYLLKEVVYTNTTSGQKIAADKLETDRLAAIKKCRIQVLIHFNNLLVCTTDEATLNPRTFSANFCKFFDLEVFERPELLSLTVRERFGRGAWQIIAKIFLPIPEDQLTKDVDLENNELEESCLNAMQFASEITRGSYKGSLGCGTLNTSPYMQGKLYCKAKWLKRGIYSSKRKSSGTCMPAAVPYLSLIPNETRLVTAEEFNAGSRLDTLQQRFQQRYKTDTRISALEDSYSTIAAGSGGMELSMDVYRRIGHNYAILLRMRHLTDNLALTQRIKSYSEIVHEEPLPTMFRAFGSIFGPPDLSRKLKPMRKTKDARIQQSLGVSMYKLVINIQSASNLPERVSGDRTRVFVEANFRKQNTRTTVVEGKQANWHETVNLDILDSNTSIEHVDFKNIVDCLQLNIFDQLITPLDYDKEPNTFHEQVESKWIGTVSIPFSTIYSLGKIDGLLTVAPPLFCSGYRMTEKHANMKLLITIDPPLLPPRITAHPAANYVCDEVDQKLVSNCERWERRLRSLFPDRRYMCMANGSNGRRILACRFLRKIPPPSKVIELASQNVRSAVLMAVNLIRCIPFIADPVMFPGVSDLWTTADEMLTIGCGDEEEHALLLICWLMSLEVSSALILGTSLPEGPKGANDLCPNDPSCPLVTVGTVVTASNIYGNIQRANHPSMLDFDLRKKSHWEPLFTENQGDLVSVQTNAIKYSHVSEDMLMELRANLEREIKFHFDEARNYGIPQWNLLASRALRDILSELSDFWQLDEGNHRHQMRDIEIKLGQLRHSYRITAVGFSRPYISKKQLVAEVLKTNIHVNSAHNVQFALAVHIQPFVNQIICCSVAVATLIPVSRLTEKEKADIRRWCGPSTVNNRIVGGQVASIGQFLYPVVITSDTGGTHCGSSLITHRHLLTARHCFDKLTDGLRSSKTGYLLKICHKKEPETCEAGNMLQLEIEFAIFDSVADYLYGDFAIIQLKQAIEDHLFEDKKVGIVCLPETKHEEIPTKITLVGWGHGNTLRYVYLDTWEQCYNDKNNSKYPYGTEAIFCAYSTDWKSEVKEEIRGGESSDSGSGAVAFSSHRRVYVLHGLFVSAQKDINSERGYISVAQKIVYYLDDLCYYLDLCSSSTIGAIAPKLSLASVYIPQKHIYDYRKAIFPHFQIIQPRQIESIVAKCQQSLQQVPINACHIEPTWAAAIVNTNEHILCGATFVTNRHLITSRECIVRHLKLNNEYFSVAAKYRIKFWKVEFFAYSYSHQIAIVQLMEEINDPLVIPICLLSVEKWLDNWDGLDETYKGADETSVSLNMDSDSKIIFKNPKCNLFEREYFCTHNIVKCYSFDQFDYNFDTFNGGSSIVKAKNKLLKGIRLSNTWAEHNNVGVYVNVEQLLGALCIYLNRCDQQIFVFHNQLPYFTTFYYSKF